jgi:hypothetical protein
LLPLVDPRSKEPESVISKTEWSILEASWAVARKFKSAGVDLKPLIELFLSVACEGQSAAAIASIFGKDKQLTARERSEVMAALNLCPKSVGLSDKDVPTHSGRMMPRGFAVSKLQ